MEKIAVPFAAVEEWTQDLVAVASTTARRARSAGRGYQERCSFHSGENRKLGGRDSLHPHHGAPEVALEVQSRGEFFGAGSSRCGRRIEEAIVSKSVKHPPQDQPILTSAPAAQTATAEFAASFPMIKEVAVGGVCEQQLTIPGAGLRYGARLH